MTTLTIPATTTTGGAALPSAVVLGVRRTRIELVQFFRERDAVIFIFAYPIIMLAIFATVLFTPRPIEQVTPSSATRACMRRQMAMGLSRE